MMTEEALYARLREALRDAIARHHLDERSISLKSRGLTPEEAIGRTARTDYPILNGREVMLQARFLHGTVNDIERAGGFRGLAGRCAGTGHGA